MDDQLLGGRYQLLARVGGGGMAIVYKAKDLVLNRPVAVKLLRPQFGTDEDFVQRFRREAQSVASLSHPNIVSVYDVGQEGDTYYMVMEYIEGPTLKEIINTQGALPVREAVRIATQICDALDHAHQNHIIHRDIKPHNILINRNGWVKVTDFGIARAVTSATITHTGSVLGSVHYFSPEQARGGITGEKSDIYSLGIVLYEMVTGELPFSGDSPISIALMHLQNPLPEPRIINPDIPQALENVILKALVKDPFLRYASAKEMLEDLRTCLSPERSNEEKIVFPNDGEETRVFQAITPEMLEQAKTERQSLSRSDDDGEEDVPPKRKKWWKTTLLWTGGIAAFIVLVVAGILLLMSFGTVKEIRVPRVEGMQLVAAREKLKEVNLDATVVEQYSEKDVGIVVSQDPPAPTTVKENSSVTLIVSKGKQQVKMPNVVNLDERTATDLLKLNNFTYTIEKRETSDTPGKVLEQDPAPNEMVIPSDIKVRLVISEPKKETQVPNVIGKDLATAINMLTAAGLDKGEVKEEASYDVQQPNIVLSMRPYDPGMSVDMHQPISLVVSNGKLPSDAKVSTAVVMIPNDTGEPMQIKIVRKDSRNQGKEEVVDEETITEAKQYNVDLVLAPGKTATVTVYKNGQQDPMQTQTIDYNTIQQ